MTARIVRHRDIVTRHHNNHISRCINNRTTICSGEV